MTDPVSRPTFYEGEILPAADLIATVDYSRNQMARHDRYSHSWGIATGLDVSGKSATSGATAYKVVTVAAGLAIDGTGREIVVPDPVSLTPADFQQEIKPLTDTSAWYPFFLVGLDRLGAPSSNLTGACNSSQPTSTQEAYDIVYGNPGDELNLDQQQGVANFEDGPGNGNTSQWRVLLGFVQWNPSIQQFNDVTNVNGGIGPRYVGVNAAEVISGSGSLLLATDPPTPGSNAVMAVQIQEVPPQLVFGKLGADGKVTTPALTVKANGDVIATGQISGTSIPISMQVQSGIASDGMILPLPPGVDPTAANLTIHVEVSLRYDLSLSPPSGPATPVALPLECTVDTATRRVSCRLNWWDAQNWNPLNVVVTPAACDYLVVVAVSA